MSDKKNEDYAIRMPDSGSRSPFGGEKDPFIPSRPSRVASHNPLSSRLAQVENNPTASIIAYCFASISMTVVNKYVVSGSEWNLNFFYLAVQVIKIHHFLDWVTIADALRIVDSVHRNNPDLEASRCYHQLGSL